jgi:hypothetical protein
MANGGGLLKSNKFDVFITAPKGLLGTPASQQIQNTNGIIELFIEGAPIPGVAALTNDVRRYGYGASEKNAVLPLFIDWPVTVRLDGKGLIHDFFRQWMRMMLNFESAGPDNDGTIHDVRGALPDQRVYETAFKDDYVTDGMITTYADNGDTAVQIRMRDMFPIHIGEVIMDWSRVNDYARLPVTFAYMDWSSTMSPAIHPSNQS